MVEIAKQVAKRYQTLIAISGEVDVVSDGLRTVLVKMAAQCSHKLRLLAAYSVQYAEHF